VPRQQQSIFKQLVFVAASRCVHDVVLAQETPAQETNFPQHEHDPRQGERADQGLQDGGRRRDGQAHGERVPHDVQESGIVTLAAAAEENSFFSRCGLWRILKTTFFLVIQTSSSSKNRKVFQLFSVALAYSAD
jgi:hypothetical protein